MCQVAISYLLFFRDESSDIKVWLINRSGCPLSQMLPSHSAPFENIYGTSLKHPTRRKNTILLHWNILQGGRAPYCFPKAPCNGEEGHHTSWRSPKLGNRDIWSLIEIIGPECFIEMPYTGKHCAIMWKPGWKKHICKMTIFRVFINICFDYLLFTA